MCSVPSDRPDATGAGGFVVSIGGGKGVGVGVGVGVATAGTVPVDATAGVGLEPVFGNAFGSKGGIGAPVSAGKSVLAVWSEVFLHPAINSAKRSTRWTARIVKTAIRMCERLRVVGNAPCGISGLGVFMVFTRDSASFHQVIC